MAAVAQTIKTLEDKGYLKRDGRYSRDIYLLNRIQPGGGTRTAGGKCPLSAG